jgi:pimeloyl-ACP methyl ester carboxylesterase
MRCWISAICLSLWLGLAGSALAAGFQVERQTAKGDYVVLVHGLDWFRDTLQPTADYLHAQGYETINVRYPSRKVAAPAEAAAWVREVIARECQDRKKRIHLVAHSMGALVVREYLSGGKPDRLGRVIFLAAPNQGTPLADALRWKPLARLVSPAVAASCGVKCQERLTAEAAKSQRPLPASVDYAPGVLMGNQPGWFPYLSPFLKGPDDGVVPVSSGHLDGMAALRVVRASHTGMPRNREALAEISRFLRDGRF